MSALHGSGCVSPDWLPPPSKHWTKQTPSAEFCLVQCVGLPSSEHAGVTPLPLWVTGLLLGRNRNKAKFHVERGCVRADSLISSLLPYRVKCPYSPGLRSQTCFKVMVFCFGCNCPSLVILVPPLDLVVSLQPPPSLSFLEKSIIVVKQRHHTKEAEQNNVPLGNGNQSFDLLCS